MVIFMWVIAEQVKTLSIWLRVGDQSFEIDLALTIISEQNPKMTWLMDVHWYGP